MIHIQRYSPDTCSCVLLETWDDTQASEARVHVFEAMEVICAAHQDDHGPTLYQRIVHENRRKNLVLAMAQALQPDVSHLDYTWTFDEQRQLQPQLPTLDPRHRAALQAAADLQFGPHQVRLA
jgi:hypothetical protein